MDSKTLFPLIASRTGRDVADVEKLTSALGDVIAEAVRDGDSVAVPSFGSFEHKKRMERVAMHPSTGKKILVPPKISIVFKPSALLKQKVKNE